MDDADFNKIIVYSEFQQITENINNNQMLTPTSSYTSSTSRMSSLHEMLLEFDHKILQIAQLKNHITQRVQSQQVEQSAKKQKQNKNIQINRLIQTKLMPLCRYFKDQFLQGMQCDLQKYNKQCNESAMNIVNYYERQIRKYKAYYQQQIWDLREQIKRQYKVIAMMKQQVQDLMILMKYKEQQEASQTFATDLPQRYNIQSNQTSNNRQNIPNRPNRLQLAGLDNRDRTNELDIIEQQTERTMQSSERSHGNQVEPIDQGAGFIKIQQKQDEHQQQTQMNNVMAQVEHQIIQERQEYDLPLKFDDKRNNQQIQPQTSNTKQQIGFNYDQFCENLTPGQTERVQYDNKSKPQSIFHLNSLSLNEEQRCTNKIPPTQINTKLQKSDRKYKVYTQPSQQNRPDHLQSIFFLDDEPQILNKTSKLHYYQQLDSQNCIQHKTDMKSLHQSHILQTDKSQHGMIQQLQLDVSYTKKNTLNDQQVQSVGRQSANQQLKQKNEGKYKVGKYIKYGKEEQDTSEYIMKKFNKVINLGELQNSSSMPVTTKKQPLSELPVDSYDNGSYRTSVQSKPKTKQFLQQFRKTFNKCLSSMQISKKHSGKISSSSSSSAKPHSKNSYQANHEIENSQNITAGVMTFGRGNPNTSSHHSLPVREDFSYMKGKQNTASTQKFKDLDISHNKVNSLKGVDQMLREMQNNNKFVTGGKKIQLKYQGEKRNGVRCGNGILYYSNGLCYEGQFKDGVRHGYGTLRINHIQIYNGDWAHDQIQGEGRIRNCAIINKKKIITTGQGQFGKWISYNGEFKSSKFEGQGTLHLQGGQKFVGTFVNGYAHGEGSICKKNGDVQQGYWQNGVMVSRHSEK